MCWIKKKWFIPILFYGLDNYSYTIFKKHSIEFLYLNNKWSIAICFSIKRGVYMLVKCVCYIAVCFSLVYKTIDAKEQTLAILSLKSEQVDSSTITLIERRIHEFFSKETEFNLITIEDIKSKTKTTDQQLGDCTSDSCLQRIGELCASRFVVYGSAQSTATQIMITLNAYSADEKKIAHTQIAGIGQNDEELLKTFVKEFASALSVSKQMVATMTFNSTPENASVFIGEDSIGVTPCNTEITKEGIYKVRISKVGYTEFSDYVSVKNDTSFSFAVTLDLKQEITITQTQKSPAEKKRSTQRNSQAALNERVQITPLSTLFRSSIIPGLGQFYCKEYIKGGVFLGGALLGGGFLYYGAAVYNEKDSVVKSYTAFDKSTIKPNQTTQDWISSANKAVKEKNASVRNIYIYSSILAGLWIYNCYDAWQVGRQHQSMSSHISWTLQPEIAMVTNSRFSMPVHFIVQCTF